MEVGVTDAAGGDPDEDLTSPRPWNRDSLEPERRSGLLENRCEHRPLHATASSLARF
jgi:hypothetical protein